MSLLLHREKRVCPHYTSNNQKILDGDIILMDFGAEYLNYASDLTRCVPSNGRFTQRQKNV